MLSSTTTTNTNGEEGKRVVIDGVIFQFEQGGKKLTRIGGRPESLYAFAIDTRAANDLGFRDASCSRNFKGCSGNPDETVARV